MNIGVIGGGSVGLLLCGYLSQNHTVTLYVKRDQQRKKINSNPIQIIHASERYQEADISVQKMPQLGANSCFIVCVKQGNIKEVISALQHVPKTIPLIFMQNGMGHINKIRTLPHPIYLGVVEHGARRLNDYKVEHLGKGAIKIASFSGSDKELAILTEELNSDLFPIEMMAGWEDMLKNKLIVNTVINPLTALFDVPNLAVIENDSIQFLAARLCQEAAIVLQMDEKVAWKCVQQVAKNTGLNTSSMRADMQLCQKTEIEAITGYILEEADTDLPYTSFIYHSILAMEQERITCT